MNNAIQELHREDGELHSRYEKLVEIMTIYFSKLFPSTSLSRIDEAIQYTSTRVTKEMNQKLCRLYAVEEVETALHQMYPGKALRSDGFNPYVYQKLWSIVGKEVT